MTGRFFRNFTAAFETCSRTLNKRWQIRCRRQGKPETTFPWIIKTVMGNTIVNDIVGEAVSQPTNEEQQRTERLAALSAMRVASGTEVPPEEPALTVDDVGLFALGDIHGLKGKQKCGKTTMLKVCLAAWMQGHQFRVVSPLEATALSV